MKTSTDTLSQARQALLDGREPNGALLPPAIAQSWQRCLKRGQQADRSPRLEPLGAQQLSHIRERNESLIRISRPELEGMHSEARRTRSVVILTDNRGLILDRLGDPEFANRAAQVALRPGVNWSEDATGTNAIGTALVERAPVSVEGGAHYFSDNHILSCYAAPITDPYGEIIGALDLTGPAEAPHTHALGMIRLAVDQIERRMFQQSFGDAEVIHLHPNPDMLGSFREGVMVFRDGVLIAANRVALKQFRLDASALSRQRQESLFSVSLAQACQQGFVRGPAGQMLYVKGATRPRPAASQPRTAVSPPQPSEREPIIYGQQLSNSLDRARAMLNGGLPVLIQGETGVGKEIFAKRLHGASQRAKGPFVAINCAAMPESLIEAELFGYEQGAFTGGRKNGAPGLIRQADGGVLFLDEIGDMPLNLQCRLLRVLQEREVMPLGGGKPCPVDFHLICATRQALPEAVEDGRFRSDLYYRIAQYVLALPALREHPERAELIAQLWSRMQSSKQIQLDQAVHARLASYTWPGNYRQLSAVLQQLDILGRNGIQPGVNDLPAEIRDAPSDALSANDLRGQLDTAIQHALDAAGGNVSLAARRLGVNRSTIYRRLRTH